MFYSPVYDELANLGFPEVQSGGDGLLRNLEAEGEGVHVVQHTVEKRSQDLNTKAISYTAFKGLDVTR